MPNASISASICAPRAVPKPRSVHSATMCTWGIDIATQQATPATDISAVAAVGDIPNGRARSRGERAVAAVDFAGATTATGGLGRIKSASAAIESAQKIAMPRYVWRHPASSMKCCAIGGHTAPAR
jgi:hypothetical protein